MTNTDTNGDTGNVHKFLDRDEDTSVVNQFYKLLNADPHKAADFLKTHSALGAEKINDAIALTDSDLDDQTELGSLLSDQADFHRTRAEIADAWQQVWDRRWYRRPDRTAYLKAHDANPDERARIVAAYDRMETRYADINDPAYYDAYGWGYLAGIQSALGWALGECWAMLDT